MAGDDQDFLSRILLDEQDSVIVGLDEMAIPNTQEPLIRVEEVQASRTTKGGRRAKNFHYKEDEVICLGWLSVSKDPLNGANQTKTTFWGRVHAYYEDRIEEKYKVDRSESSIMHRFLLIQASVNKFCSHHEAILRRNQSGTTIQDKYDEAKKMYVELDKEHKTFVFDHCWKILKDEDKWKAKMIELAEMEKAAVNKKKTKTSKVPRPRDEGANNDQVIPVDVEESQPRKRSDGIKKAKEKMRQGGGQACMEALSMILAKKDASDLEKEKAKEVRFMATLEIEKATLELEKKRAENEAELQKKRVENEGKLAEANLLKEQKEIMLADVSALNPTQRSWIETMQKKILANLMST